MSLLGGKNFWGKKPKTNAHVIFTAVHFSQRQSHSSTKVTGFFVDVHFWPFFVLRCSGLWTLHYTTHEMRSCFSSLFQKFFFFYVSFCLRLSLHGPHDDSRGKTADLGNRNRLLCPAAVCSFLSKGNKTEVFSGSFPKYQMSIQPNTH